MRVTWKKPRLAEGPVPLRPKPSSSEQLSLCSSRSLKSYDDPSAPSRVDGEPIALTVIEENDGQPARNLGGIFSPKSAHSLYSQESSAVSEYSHAHLMAPNLRPQLNKYRQPGVAATAHQLQAHVYDPNLQHMGGSHFMSMTPPQPQTSPLAQAPRPNINILKSEKEKMLSGEYYKLFNSQLVNEREQCRASICRFNNATNPNAGISREERARLFRSVLEAQQAHTGLAPRNPVGRAVYIEAPFTCEYGYNITIGDEVVIGPNCTILDPCRIMIGRRTIIGPNVSIFGNTVLTDSRSQKGNQATAVGREVHIEEDVYIGGNSTILPGVRIGKGSTVGAGSVVTRDVPNITIVFGNPAKIK